MRNSQTITLLLLGTIFTVSVVLILVSLNIAGGPGVANVSKVEPDCQEVAFLAPATATDTWERLVEALEHIKQQWPDNHPDMSALHVNVLDAFLPGQSAAVPEIAISVGNGPGKLLVRWYKISGEKTIDDWVLALAGRTPAPLAIIGGDTTRRAEDISNVLQSQRGKWQGADPLFLITTATKDQLTKIYKDRVYRFSFANRTMTQAVLDFIEEHPELLWPEHRFDRGVAAAMFASANGLTNAMLLQAEQKCCNFAMYGVAWKDDAYSVDLRDRFLTEFGKRYHAAPQLPSVQLFGPLPKLWVVKDEIAYSTGDYFHPNTEEIAAALRFFEGWEESKTVRQLLVLPTGTDRAKRFLKATIGCNPHVVDNLVVLSGDSITFNQVYRDRKTAWNIMEVPVPLVFFSHRNPVFGKTANANGFAGNKLGFQEKPTEDRPWATTGTQDLLLYRDILEAITLATYQTGVLVSDTDELDQRLKKLSWMPIRGKEHKAKDKENSFIDGFITFEATGNLLFSPHRNRSEGTGEYVIQLQPQRGANGLFEPLATFKIWPRRVTAGICQGWEEPVVFLDVPYADPRTPLADEALK